MHAASCVRGLYPSARVAINELLSIINPRPAQKPGASRASPPACQPRASHACAAPCPARAATAAPRAPADLRTANRHAAASADPRRPLLLPPSLRWLVKLPEPPWCCRWRERAGQRRGSRAPRKQHSPPPAPGACRGHPAETMRRSGLRVGSTSVNRQRTVVIQAGFTSTPRPRPAGAPIGAMAAGAAAAAPEAGCCI